MDFTELTTKDLIAQTRGAIRELEAKCHGSELQAAMNRRLAIYYKSQQHPNKAGIETARQQVAKDTTAIMEIQIGLPALLDHLAALQALDMAEDAAKDGSEPDDATDLDDAPIDLTEPEPTPMKAKARKTVTFDDLSPRHEARELAHV